MSERRQILEESITEVENRVLLSEVHRIKVLDKYKVSFLLYVLCFFYRCVVVTVYLHDCACV